MSWNSEELISKWEEYCKDKDFKLNPDKEHVKTVATGVLANQKEKGLKLCPCRLGDGSKERNLELICPCNFKTHETWKKEGRCWCGLFVK